MNRTASLPNVPLEPAQTKVITAQCSEGDSIIPVVAKQPAARATKSLGRHPRIQDADKLAPRGDEKAKLIEQLRRELQKSQKEVLQATKERDEARKKMQDLSKKHAGALEKTKKDTASLRKNNDSLVAKHINMQKYVHNLHADLQIMSEQNEWVKTENERVRADAQLLLRALDAHRAEIQQWKEAELRSSQSGGSQSPRRPSFGKMKARMERSLGNGGARSNAEKKCRQTSANQTAPRGAQTAEVPQLQKMPRRMSAPSASGIKVGSAAESRAAPSAGRRGSLQHGVQYATEAKQQQPRRLPEGQKMPARAPIAATSRSAYDANSGSHGAAPQARRPSLQTAQQSAAPQARRSSLQSAQPSAAPQARRSSMQHSAAPQTRRPSMQSATQSAAAGESSSCGHHRRSSSAPTTQAAASCRKTSSAPSAMRKGRFQVMNDPGAHSLSATR
uniref:Lebercilin domain-containing protein n=1 Tax=Odontella aurita TaxID=265563 RepID=A0A7S4IW62_9STRA|mmetsp:Transcript_31378/g.93903  ORF Transcript_31378/g.93903 Transcript_31378/m.93903 type:complete len:447 (+) Transcript_31378:229-1569(+)